MHNGVQVVTLVDNHESIRLLAFREAGGWRLQHGKEPGTSLKRQNYELSIP